eukprot:COSAG06_NODE_49192_length_327_cov_0.679825_1_plen_30_part_10
MGLCWNQNTTERFSARTLSSLLRSLYTLYT